MTLACIEGSSWCVSDQAKLLALSLILELFRLCMTDYYFQETSHFHTNFVIFDHISRPPWLHTDERKNVCLFVFKVLIWYETLSTFYIVMVCVCMCILCVCAHTCMCVCLCVHVMYMCRSICAFFCALVIEEGGGGGGGGDIRWKGLYHSVILIPCSREKWHTTNQLTRKPQTRMLPHDVTWMQHVCNTLLLQTVWEITAVWTLGKDNVISKCVDFIMCTLYNVGNVCTFVWWWVNVHIWEYNQD